jgi:hypothetical protein
VVVAGAKRGRNLVVEVVADVEVFAAASAVGEEVSSFALLDLATAAATAAATARLRGDPLSARSESAMGVGLKVGSERGEER